MMKWKKWLSGLFVIICLAGVSLYNASDVHAARRVEIRLDGGPSGGGKNFRNTAMAEAIKRVNPAWDVSVITGPPSSVVLGMMQRGEVELATIPAMTIYELKGGKFGGKPMAGGPLDVRWVFSSNYYLAAVYVLSEVPVDSIDELLAKKYPIKMSVGERGSPPYIFTNLILNAYNVTLDDLKGWGAKIHYQPSGRSIKLVRDGHIQGKFHVGTVPEPAWEDLSRTRKLKILTIKSEDVNKKLEGVGFEPKVIPGGSYNFNPSDIPTLGMPNFLVLKTDADDEMAYHIARSMWEQREFLKSMHPIFQRNLNKEAISNLYRGFGKFAHPGAVKYWKEIGAIR